MLDNLLKIGKTKGKRVGRGYGSGKGGHTIGRGQKGHKSRSGYSNPRPGFEGGSMPLSRRIPKLKGFSRQYLKIKFPAVSFNLSTIDKNYAAGETVNMETLHTKKLIKAKVNNIKIIGNGEFNKKVIFEGIKFSTAAKAILEAAGCELK